MKKITLIVLILVIITTTTVVACGETSSKHQVNSKIVSVINNQKTKDNKTIVIDPGHSNKANLQEEALSPGSSVMKVKDGGGAQGIITKTPEYLINMEVSLKLRYLLMQRGYTIIMTKTDNSLSLGNIERAEIGNKADANLVIRIHCDANDNSSAKGASVLVPKVINSNTKAIYKESLRCGTIVLNNLTSEVGMVKRGVIPQGDMTGFNWSKVPVILVEMGFQSNAAEDKLLSMDDYQNKLAKGLADGISNSIK